MPEHHIENMKEGTRPGGFYAWFDVDVVDALGNVTPLRLCFNDGDADANDGFWGAYWARDTGALVANIKSDGDCLTLVEAVPSAFAGFAEVDGWLPQSDHFKRHEIKTASSAQIEQILALALRAARAVAIGETT